MKIELHTFRYSREVPILMHGRTWLFEPEYMLLTVTDAVQQDGSIALQQVFTIVAGDDFVVVPCGLDCDLHGVEDAAKNS